MTGKHLTFANAKFAIQENKHTLMTLIENYFPFSPLEGLFGLLALIGIVVFVVACWRIIHSNDEE